MLSKRNQRRMGLESLECRNLLTTLRPELVADLNQDQAIYDIDHDIMQVRDTTLFVANSLTSGTELFTSDGTDEGSTLWADLNPGFASSNPTDFAVSPSSQFGLFKATIRERDAIWHTDGTKTIPVMISGYDQSEELEILAVTDQGAFIQRGFAHEDESGRGSAYVSDVFFVGGDTAHLSLLGSFEGEYHTGGIASHGVSVRPEDGHMLFQNCADRCTVWSTDGTFHNTQPLASLDYNANIFEVGGELYFRESPHFGPDGATFQYESGSDAVAVQSELLDSPWVVANRTGFLSAQPTSEAGIDRTQLLFATSLDAEPIAVAESGPNGFVLPYATDSALVAVVIDGSGTALVSVDEAGGVQNILDANGSRSSYARLLANDGETLVFQIQIYDAVEGNSASIWKTDGTVEGTQLVTSDVTGFYRSTIEFVGDKLWISQVAREGRSITVHNGSEVESTITDQWAYRTGGIYGFGMEPFKDGYIAYSSHDLWRVDASLESFEPIARDEVVNVSNVLVFPDNVWYVHSLPGESQFVVSVNQGTADSNLRLDSLVPEFSGFSNARMVGDKLVLLAGAASPFDGATEVWASDGTIEGTTKVYENDAGALAFHTARSEADGNEIFLRVLLPDSDTIEWLLSDGTPIGTRPVDFDEVPNSSPKVVTHTISGGVTYTHNGRKWTATGPVNEYTLEGDWLGGSFDGIETVLVDRVLYFTASTEDGFGLYRIQPGNQNGLQFFSPKIERYLDLTLSESTLVHADGHLIVVHDDGFHGHEPYRIPIASSPYLGSEDLSCINALDLQRGIRVSSEDPFEINRLDVNGDFQLNQADLDEWARLHDAAGDVNVNGRVDAGDLNIIGRNWQEHVDNGWCDGDLNGDGIVSAPDLNLVGENWPSENRVGVAARTPRAPLAQVVAPRIIIEMNAGEVDARAGVEFLNRGSVVEESRPSTVAIDFAWAEYPTHRGNDSRVLGASDAGTDEASRESAITDSLRSWRQLELRR